VAAGIGIAYLDGSRLRRSLLAAADWVAAGREELNRENVFPVPDGDTGTNLCFTLREVAQALRRLDDAAPLPRVTEAVAQASVRGARGNSGMLLSQFLLGLRDGLGDRVAANARDLARAVRRGFQHVRDALDEPVEGTILTVVREAADEAAHAEDERDLRVFVRRLVARAERALERTPELLAALRAAGVVDAGAKGFVRLLEGVKRLIDEGHVAPGPLDAPASTATAEAAVAPERDFGFCTELLVRGGSLPPVATVREALRPLGGSIVVLQTGDLLKVHVHTDTPDAVVALGARWGAIEATKAEDMRAQRRARRRRAVVFVADTACDLPDSVVVEHGIGLVPTQLIVGERAYRDRLELTSSEFFRRLRAGEDATTSQPTAQAFEDAYRDALRQGEHVIAVVLSRALSGTCAAAEAAARRLDPDGRRITVVDSRSASLGEGLLVLLGVELAGHGWAPAAIAHELRRVRDQSGGLFTVDNLERLVRSGRVGRVAAWLGTRLNVKPIMAVSRDGTVAPVARTRGRATARRRLLERLDRAIGGRTGALRLGIAHADVPELAEDLRAELVARYRPRTCVVSPITPVIAAHAGIGAWGVFYQIEDGNKAAADRL
jgi:DegV family protein with EDD domain